jgi:hypothetical protein
MLQSGAFGPDLFKKSYPYTRLASWLKRHAQKKTATNRGGKRIFYSLRLEITVENLVQTLY